ncbi:MAG: MucR family transcriptional regulator [Pseudomonadota bacterium]
MNKAVEIENHLNALVEAEEHLGNDLVQCTAQIVAAFVQKTKVQSEELLPLITKVHQKLFELRHHHAPQTELRPAIPIDESVTENYIICLEDGKKFKMLKKHLMSIYGLTPQEYRRKWGLPADYPMTAPSYAKRRQELAKEIGLGLNKS